MGLFSVIQECVQEHLVYVIGLDRLEILGNLPAEGCSPLLGDSNVVVNGFNRIQGTQRRTQRGTLLVVRPATATGGRPQALRTLRMIDEYA
jgi:hypothetical protein